MPTNVLSRNTWGRNGRPTALLSVLPLYLELGSVFSELVCVVALRVPAVLAVGGLGVGDISGNPLLLLLGLTCFYALIFAVLGSGVLIAVPAGFAI